MSDAIKQDGSVPDPMSDAYAVQLADVMPIRRGAWQSAGDWKWREFGRELQLRNSRLPHLTLDLFRSEAEALLTSLAVVCAKPMPLPYRVPWHERLKQWWMRHLWNRKHAVEQDEARAALIKEFAERGPWA